MPDFASALYGWITSDAAVTADIGTRFYPVKVPQNAARPYVRYQTISDPRPQHLKGYQSARTTRIQVDVFADSYGVARRIAENIITAAGAPGIHGGIHFGRVKAEGPRDLGEDTSSGFVHRASVDLLAEHKFA